MLQIVEWFVVRWQVEVTYEEARRHLGVETQRQWSDQALLGLSPGLPWLLMCFTYPVSRSSLASRLGTLNAGQPFRMH